MKFIPKSYFFGPITSIRTGCCGEEQSCWVPLVLPPVPVGAGNDTLHVVRRSTWKSNQGREKPRCSAVHVATASGTEHFLKAVVSCYAPEEAAVPGGAIGVCCAACCHGVVFVWWRTRGKLSLSPQWKCKVSAMGQKIVMQHWEVTLPLCVYKHKKF